MIFDQVTEPEMDAARILGGATMVAFLAAPMFRRHAQKVQMVVTGLYIAGVLAFVLYVLI